VNSSSYRGLHSGQMFQDGLSFSGHERDKVWINGGPDQGFADVSFLSGADSPNDGRAALAADFDDDGDQDLFVHNIQRERHGLYRNDAVQPGAPGSGFVKLRLRATTTQYEGIGAMVVVEGPEGPTAQVHTRGAGFVSCQPAELVFGLGDAARADVSVLWPGGKRESFGSVAANGRYLLVEGAGHPTPFNADPRPLPDPLPPGLLLEEGDILPTFELRDADGQAVTLDIPAAAAGKTVFLNLWASYCAPCVAEIPDLQELQDDEQYEVIAISVDAPAAKDTAVKLLEARGGRYRGYYLMQDGGGLEALVDLERLPIPTTLVLTPEGRIDTILRGPLEN